MNDKLNNFPVEISFEERFLLWELDNATNKWIDQNLELLKNSLIKTLENKEWWSSKYYPAIDHIYWNEGISIENQRWDQIIIYFKHISWEPLDSPVIKLIVNNILTDLKLFQIHLSFDYEDWYVWIEGAFWTDSHIEIRVPKLKDELVKIIKKISRKKWKTNIPWITINE